MRGFARWMGSLLCVVSAYASAQPWVIRDDSGVTLQLPGVPQRIISLSPHATELLFEVGAGAQVVGVSAYSNYPLAAKQKTVIGDISAIDLERIRALQPDLIVAWQSGNRASDLAQLRALGIPLYFSEIQRLDALPAALLRLGLATGHPRAARQAAARVSTALAKIKASQAGKPPIRVFYQIWHQPLMTVSRQQYIGDALALCHADNPFGALPGLAPTVGLENVLATQPQAIINATADGKPDAALQAWQRFTDLPAVKYHNLIALPADEISRPTPRMLGVVARLCTALDAARLRLR